MSKLIILVGVFVFAASQLFAESKCESAKAYLNKQRANLIPTFNLETSNQKIKLIQQEAIETLGLLDRAVERNHEFLCGYGLKELKEDVDFIEKNL